jgi:hypothetical protein
VLFGLPSSIFFPVAVNCDCLVLAGSESVITEDNKSKKRGKRGCISLMLERGNV